ncbi:DNA-methyltransferase [Proteiniclasticum ruminis]|uniref:DNA-methyltransferase n=1 Tax=Proteiniclasticum ruminis TaxID=398199 RepID=UPI0028A8BFED|nr:DNA methyltransferase [Proteiniclasticum ruminis]
MEKKFHVNKLFRLLNIQNKNDLLSVSKKIGITTEDLRYYNDNRILPYGNILGRLLDYLDITEAEFKISLGLIDNTVLEWLESNSKLVAKSLPKKEKKIEVLQPKFKSEFGTLFQGDCIQLMRSLPEESVDLIFADPPFNLSKVYESGIDDNISEDEYLKWTEDWIVEAVRLLKPGGSIFVYNIPKWSTETATILNRYLEFRHWISLNFRGYTPPIKYKLNVTHYGLLYYIKGKKPAVFNPQRIPMKTCRHCGGEIHDYGGKKKDVSDLGQVISDVWEDIHPVRHKSRKTRESNELPIKLLLRIISLASNDGDVVFDPFGGSGTTYKAAEMLRRRWIGVEIGDVQGIIDRINGNISDYERLEEFNLNSNVVFTNEQIELRRKNGFWLPEDFK